MYSVVAFKKASLKLFFQAFSLANTVISLSKCFSSPLKCRRMELPVFSLPHQIVSYCHDDASHLANILLHFYVGSTNIFFGGNITFNKNIAMNGAGLMLADNSVMYLRQNTYIMFSNNHARHAGGAIYAESIDTGSIARCFYQFDGENHTKSNHNIQITFENNTAYFAGSALYGGSVDFCSLVPFYSRTVLLNNSFDSIFKVQNTEDDPSAISSDPYKVCLCDENKPHCGNQKHWSIFTYPGALFHVQAVVVGQKNGIVPGVVF